MPLPKFSFQAVLLILTIMASAAYGEVELTSEEDAALQKIAQGTNKFAIKLYQELSKKNAGNLFVSPLSAQLVLALAYTGAKAETAQELASLLSLPDNIQDTYLGYSALIKILQDPVLKLANRMFVDAAADVKKEFQASAEKHFQSPAELVNFRGEAEKSRKLINSWVEEHTNKKIKNLLAEGVVDSLTRLILVNAIHFKANWRWTFDKEKTKEEPFHTSPNTTVPVQMMHIKKKFYYTYNEELKSKILELDYEGLRFRLIVILPDAIDGLAELESKLETVNIADAIKYVQERTVNVALPKFKLEETMELKDVLANLGARTMFTDKANFKGLSDQDLVVSKVVQKAFVEVNEKGTEAAAATAGVIRLRRSLEIEEEPSEFIADHPFAFIISHSTSNSILFVGKFSSPTDSLGSDETIHDEL